MFGKLKRLVKIRKGLAPDRIIVGMTVLSAIGVGFLIIPALGILLLSVLLLGILTNILANISLKNEIKKILEERNKENV